MPPQQEAIDEPIDDGKDVDELVSGGDSDEDILEISNRRFKLAEDAEIEMRILEVEDKQFFSGDQWDKTIEAHRKARQRPIVTVNRLPQQVRQVTNDQRQNRPSIQVNPLGSKATVETAKVRQGIIRHIEYNSDADLAYDTGFESAGVSGRGYWRVYTDYADPMSFNQEIKIGTILNNFMVYLDPAHTKPDGSDTNWGFVFEDVPVEDYRSQWPDSDIAKSTDSGIFETIETKMPGWAKNKTIRVSEYFYKTFKRTKIYLLSDGSVVAKEKLKAALKAASDAGHELKIVKERETILPAIKWVMRDAIQILEKKEWAGTWIPIIECIGQRSDIDGKKIIEGIVRNAKDSQRIFNYMKSAMIETIALAPRAPYIIAEGQVEGHEGIWETLNTENHAYLPYKMTDLNGQNAPPPQRSAVEPPIQAMNMVMNEAGEDIKATTGVFDPTLGRQKADQSGVAIQKLNSQAQTSNFHLIDNLTRSIRHTGRIVNELIDVVYDTPQIIRILGEDGVPKMVPINQTFMDQGQETSHMLGDGKYDITVSTGPSYQTKRQEAVASMIDLVKVYPKLLDVAGDLFIGEQDWPMAKEISERIKKTMPPGIAEDDDDDKQPLPPQVAAQMQQMQGMIQQLTQHLEAKTKIVEQKTLELESKERIETLKVKAQLEIALATLKAKGADTLLDHEISILSAREAQLGANEPPDSEIDETSGQSAVTPNQQQPSTGGNPSPAPMGG